MVVVGVVVELVDDLVDCFFGVVLDVVYVGCYYVVVEVVDYFFDFVDVFLVGGDLCV